MTSRQHDAHASEPARLDEDDRRSSLSGVLASLAVAIVPILLITLIAGYGAYKYSERQPATYSATSQVVLSASTNFSPIAGSFSNSSPDRYVENQAAIVTTIGVADIAAAALADGVPGSELRSNVTAAPAGASDVINVTATAETAALAAARADAVANAYAAFNQQQVTRLADAAIASVGPTVTEQAQVLVQDIRARAVTFGSGVQFVQPANVPSDPTAPMPARNAYLAGAAAFLISLGLVLALRGRRRTTSPARLASTVGGPLLAEVPVRWFGSVAVPRQPGRARYAIAVQALRHRLRGTTNASVLVTGAHRDGSATSALLGLAAADAAQGHRVVIVDATDGGRLLRRAGATSPSVSLNSALAGGGALDAAFTTVSGSNGAIRAARVDRSAAATPEVLRSSLAAVLQSADLVLVDAGTAVEDSVAFAFLSEVGAVVTVVRAKDRGGASSDLRSRLQLAGRDADGVLVTHRTWLPGTGGSSGDQPVRPAAAPAPASSRPAAAQPAAVPSMSTNGQPANGQPANGQPVGQPVNGQPTNTQYANGQPANGHPENGQVTGRSTGATTADGSAPADSSGTTR